MEIVFCVKIVQENPVVFVGQEFAQNISIIKWGLVFPVREER